MGTISKDFSYSEFEASDTAKSMHIDNTITSSEVRDNIKSLVLEVLQPLRDKWCHPIKINSGYRCAKLNEAVGGVPTSQHTKGEAADLKATDPYLMAKRIVEYKLPFDQVILYPTFVHVSHKRNGPQRGKVLYNYRYKGKKL